MSERVDANSQNSGSISLACQHSGVYNHISCETFQSTTLTGGYIMKRQSILVLASVLVFAASVSGDMVQGINMDFVTIGNAGNAADSTGYGSVGYDFSIGKYEVTNAQWNTFVSAAGAPTGTGGGYDVSAYFTGDQQPTNRLSWLEAAQFCNYLTTGDRYSGAYNFDQSGTFLNIDRDSAVSAYGIAYVIPTEDEWYKAAYYTGSGYSTYANGTDIAPVAGVETNYNQALPPDGPWDVGTGIIEQNGTFDMMGNVWEWNEVITPTSGFSRGVRGGSYRHYDYHLASS
jgi:sulfatase modifying factor 1